MKPVENANHARNAMHEPIAATNMLQLMDHGSPRILAIPGWCIDRKQDHGTKQATSHRSGDGLMQENSDGSAYTNLARELSHHFVCIRPGTSEPARVAELPQTDRDR